MAQAGHWRRVVTIRPLAASPNLPTEPTPTPASASVAAARAARTPPAVAARRSTARDAVGGGGAPAAAAASRAGPSFVAVQLDRGPSVRRFITFFFIFLRAISSPVPARHVVWLRVVTVNLVSSSCRERERERETPSAGLDFCQLSHRVGEDTALTS